VLERSLLERPDRSEHAWIGGGEKTHQRDPQEAGVEVIVAVALHERVASWIEAALADLCVDPPGQLGPTFDRPRIFVFANHLDRDIERNPRFDLGVGIVPRLGARLPDPRVGLLPYSFDVIE